jgi:hypothetical protein
MTQSATDEAIRLLLGGVRARLTEAGRIARAAEACAMTGSIGEGVSVSMDLERILYEAGRLQDAASLLHRLAREETL